MSTALSAAPDPKRSTAPRIDRAFGDQHVLGIRTAIAPLTDRPVQRRPDASRGTRDVPASRGQTRIVLATQTTTLPLIGTVLQLGENENAGGKEPGGNQGRTTTTDSPHKGRGVCGQGLGTTSRSTP